MTLLWVMLGGAVGAVARSLTDHLVRRRWDHALPLGTLIVNLTGSLLLGVIAGAAPPTAWSSALGAGFCGALTTYSTFAYETVGLAEVGRGRVAAAYAVGSVASGLLAVSAGWWLGQSF